MSSALALSLAPAIPLSDSHLINLHQQHAFVTPKKSVKRTREPQQPLGMAAPNIPGRSESRRHLPSKSPGSDSDASNGSPSRRRCFCGSKVIEHGIYCSAGMPSSSKTLRLEPGDVSKLISLDCARQDAFSSLCFKTGSTSSAATSVASSRQPSLASAISDSSLSRQPSADSITTIPIPDVPEWNASHYRRVARADLRREERKEERRRRRAEGSLASSTVSRATTLSTVSSVISSSSSRVPDLVGGQGLHSRNPSTASSVASSASTWSSNLSRNPSSASNVSSASRRYRGDQVEVIHEDNDEEEFLDSRPHPYPRNGTFGHKKSRSGSVSRTRIPEPIGMGKDMRDILEEIIEMEKGFNVDDDIQLAMTIDGGEDTAMAPPQGLFTAAFDRPPRTPSPVGRSHGEKRKKTAAAAPDPPNAPVRGHRSTFSNPMASPRSGVPHRPPSLMGLHQSSLSESHTALYLATASPVQATRTVGSARSGRRSASPHLQQRNSITFTPESGPILAFGNNNLPSGLTTPSRRRPQVSPNANYGAMDGWRFPSGAGSTSETSTPVVLNQSSAASLGVASRYRNPNRQDSGNTIMPPTMGLSVSSDGLDRVLTSAHLWPSQQQSLFPTSPGVDTPQFISALNRRPAQNQDGRVSPGMQMAPGDMMPPRSGMKLGVLLGSGEEDGDVDMQVDIAMDGEPGVSGEDEGSTAHGHEFVPAGTGLQVGSEGDIFARSGFQLPVFLEAEGFRITRRWG